MAKGYQQHQERLQLLGLLGKPLARRAGRRCELCETSDTELRPFEIPPVSVEPDLDQMLLLCVPCNDQIRDPRKIQPERWRCLETAIWSTLPATQVVALWLLRRLVPLTPWANEVLEMIDLDPEIEKRVSQMI